VKCVVCDNKKLSPVINLDWPLYRCLNCGLVQVSPLPSQQAVNKLYSGDYWKNYAPYESQIRAHRRYFQEKIKQIKQYRKQGKILDIGCALGIFMETAKKNHYQVEGIDISDYPVKYCRKNGLAAEQKTIHTINKKNDFDIVTAFEIIEHELDPVEALNDINHVLKPHGLLVVSVPNSQMVISRIMGKYWFGYRDKEHLFHFTKESLLLLLKKAGFTQIKIMNDSPRPYLFTYYLERFNYYLLRSKIFSRFVIWLTKLPIINEITINLNPWGNLIAFATKPNDQY